MINKRCNDLINAWHELTRVFDLFCKRRRKDARNEEKTIKNIEAFFFFFLRMRIMKLNR